MKSVTIEIIQGKLAANIVELRKRRKIAQEALADEAGIDRTILGKIERRVSNPTISTLLKIANALEVPIAELLQ